MALTSGEIARATLDGGEEGPARDGTDLGPWDLSRDVHRVRSTFLHHRHPGSSLGVRPNPAAWGARVLSGADPGGDSRGQSSSPGTT